MNPSSRTPEGRPHQCPVCGKQVLVEPSTYPLLDGPCPRCGHLLSFETSPMAAVDTHHDLASVVDYSSSESSQHEPFDQFDRRTWTGLAIVTTLVVWIDGTGLLASCLWLLGVLAFGQLILPRVFRFVHHFCNQERFWLTVPCAWALVSGLPVGLLFGVLSPYIEGTHSSIHGGLWGLLIGPPVAAVLGLAIAGVISLVVWIVTGKSLTQFE